AVPPILFAILAFVGAGVFHTENGKLTGSEFAGLGDAVARIILVFGIVSLAYGVAKLIAGIRTLAGRNGWRVTGVVLASIAAAFAGDRRCVDHAFEGIGLVEGPGQDAGQVALREDADERPPVQDRQVPDPLVGHDPGGLAQRHPRVGRDDVLGHGVRHAGVER